MTACFFVLMKKLCETETEICGYLRFRYVFKHILLRPLTHSITFPKWKPNTPTWSDRNHANCRASCSSTSGFCTVDCDCSLCSSASSCLENLSGLIKQEVEAYCMVLNFTAGAKLKHLQLWMCCCRNKALGNFNCYKSGLESKYGITAYKISLGMQKSTSNDQIPII